MEPRQQFEAQDVDVRRYEYEDSVVLAADFGFTDSASVDVVDETVIVVVDGEQFDVEIESDAKAFIRNGILTIEVNG